MGFTHAQEKENSILDVANCVSKGSQTYVRHIVGNWFRERIHVHLARIDLNKKEKKKLLGIFIEN